MNIFTDVKAAVTTRQAAVFYGLKVSASGMTCCPFHPDKHPSMKVDERYYCFGCHQTGDVIHFVASLFHLGQYEAAMKLASDFHIQVSDDERSEKKKVRKGFVPFKPDIASLSAKVAAIQAEAAQHQREVRIFHAADVLAQYRLLLGAWREQYAPQNEEDDWHPLFVEACTQADIVDYLFTLIDDPQEHDFLYTEYREEVIRIDERMINTGQPPLSEEYLEQVRAAIRDTLEKTEKGGIAGSIQNCVIVFENDPTFAGKISRNLLKETDDTLAGQIYDFMERYEGDKLCSKQIYKEALDHAFDEPKQWETREIYEIVNMGIANGE